MQNLVSMELDANNLEGTLPAAWASMKSLKLMDLSTNYLTGALPTDWAGSPNLTLLLLGDNGFQGEKQCPISTHNQQEMRTLRYIQVARFLVSHAIREECASRVH